MAQALPAVALAKAGRRAQGARHKVQDSELRENISWLPASCFGLRFSVSGLPSSDSGLPSSDFRLIIIMIVLSSFILEI
jgi:hypothetical protein